MEFKLQCIKDSSVNQWIFPEKARETGNHNYGASKELKSNGMFNVPVFSFDMTPLKGKKISKAWLYTKYVEHPIVKYEISTISTTWDEGTGDGLKNPKFDGIHMDVRGENKPWPNNLSFNHFIFSNGNSSYHVGQTEILQDNWQRMEIPPALVYENVYGLCDGFALVDAKAQKYLPYKIAKYEYAMFNKNVYSRESNFPPYLLVEAQDFETVGDMDIIELMEMPFSHSLKFDMGQMELSWKIKGNGEYPFFRLLLDNGKEVIEGNTWEIPRYRNGVESYRTVLTGLEPEKQYVVTLQLWDINGLKAEKTIKATSVKAKEKPSIDLSKIPTSIDGSSILSEGVYIIDENSKVDPVSGEIYNDDFDGNKYTLDTIPSLVKNGKVTLKGMKNEFVSFQLILRDADINTSVEVKVVELKNGSDAIEKIDIFKLWYLNVKGRWYPEVTIPLDQDISKLLGRDPSIEGQKYQAYYVDIYIPSKAKSGYYTGKISLMANGKPIDVELEVKVLPYTIPEKVSFVGDLNGYSPSYTFEGYPINKMPDETALKYEEGYFKRIHEQRFNYNVLGYSQTGQVYPGYAPELEGEGADIHVKSWEEWDKRFEKYFTGEAFKDCPRSGIPITNIYLPFFENWPASINKYYKVKIESKNYPDNINEHTDKSTLPAQDFDPEYMVIFKKILKEFILHIEEKGWKDVKFQFFLNNKYYYKDPNFVENSSKVTNGTSWWLLDEPFFRDDWHALHFFGSMLKEVQEELKCGYNVVFRADLSFYYLQFYYLDGILDLSCTSGGVPPRQADYIKYRQEYFNEEVWIYCGMSEPDASNMPNNYATPMTAYLKGCTGYLPWMCYARYENYEKPASTAIIYPAGRAGSYLPNVSFRLKMARRALQDIEYLCMLQKKFGYDNQQIESIVKDLMKAGSSDEPESWWTVSGKMHYIDSIKLRELVEMMLEQ